MSTSLLKNCHQHTDMLLVSPIFLKCDSTGLSSHHPLFPFSFTARLLQRVALTFLVSTFTRLVLSSACPNQGSVPITPLKGLSKTTCHQIHRSVFFLMSYVYYMRWLVMLSFLDWLGGNSFTCPLAPLPGSSLSLLFAQLCKVWFLKDKPCL